MSRSNAISNPNAHPAPPANPFTFTRLLPAIGVAVVLNLAVYAIGSAAGATWIANGQTVGWILVILSTAVSMAIGGGITYLLARRWSKAPSAMAWIGLAFGLVTAPSPLFASENTTTGWALASMHVVTGLAWFIAVRPRHRVSGG